LNGRLQGSTPLTYSANGVGYKGEV